MFASFFVQWLQDGDLSYPSNEEIMKTAQIQVELISNSFSGYQYKTILSLCINPNVLVLFSLMFASFFVQWLQDGDPS